MKDRNEKLFLADIKEACEKIERYIAVVSEEDFRANGMLQDALVRNIEIIGEAAKNLSDKTRGENAAIPWRDVMRMRDAHRASLLSPETRNNLANCDSRHSCVEVADK